MNPTVTPQDQTRTEGPRWDPGTRVRLFRHDLNGCDDSGRPITGVGEPFPTPIGTEGTVDSWMWGIHPKVWIRITDQKFPQLLVDRPWESWTPV